MFMAATIGGIDNIYNHCIPPKKSHVQQSPSKAAIQPLENLALSNIAIDDT